MSKKGLKITNDKSSVQAPINPITNNLQEAATEAANRLAEYKKRSWDLGIKFRNLMESSILPENKSTILKDLESEVLAQLAQLATDINNDASQPEGIGSIAVNQLIMKMLLLQRDTYNKQKFELEKLKQTVDNLTAIVDDLKSNVIQR